MKKNKVFIFGIDGMAPEFILEKWINDLPTFKYLRDKGLFGRIQSTIPPTSIAAWTSFFSGRDPGEAGIYHYIKRFYPNQTSAELITSENIKVKRIWDILGSHGKKSIVLNVLPTYPARPINGIILTGLLTPKFDEKAFYPQNLKSEIIDIIGNDYMFDISDFGKHRDMGYDKIIKDVYKMSKTQLGLVKNFLRNKEWDFFSYTLVGTDTLHHSLWRYIDPLHLKFESGSKYSNVIKDFYQYLDKELENLISLLDSETTLIVSSDHGMNRLDGRINLNDWLYQKGYLVLNDGYDTEIKREVKKFDPKRIDWNKTRVFTTGAYEAMLFVNKKVVKDGEYNDFCDRLAFEISTIPDKNSKAMNTKVFKAKDIYKNGYDENAPDMIVYFDNLFWGTNSDLGHKDMYSWANLVGADDALHSAEGTFFMYGANVKKKGDLGKISILDIAPTILDLYNLKPEKDMQGRAIDYK